MSSITATVTNHTVTIARADGSTTRVTLSPRGRTSARRERKVLAMLAACPTCRLCGVAMKPRGVFQHRPDVVKIDDVEGLACYGCVVALWTVAEIVGS